MLKKGITTEWKKYVHIKITEMLSEKGISKTKICKDLDLQRGNLNKYCKDDFKRIDAKLLIKLCEYFECGISDLLEIKEKPDGILKPVRKNSLNDNTQN